ncbi:MAG: S-layer homology domain-containing protein [Clostridiales bacterium]|nr:S-layer homology domain-containing protein [Clostridiales bacterium]
MRNTRFSGRFAAFLLSFLAAVSGLRVPALASGSVSVALSYQADGSGFRLARRAVAVSPGLSEEYGYADAYYGTAATALDAIVAAHIAALGEGNVSGSLTVGPTGFLSNFMGDGSGNFVYFVNGSLSGAAAGSVRLNDGDAVELFSIQDAYAYSDARAWFERDGKRAGALTVGKGVSFDLALKGIDCVIYGEGSGAGLYGYRDGIEGALAVLLADDPDGGAYIDAPLGETGAGGVISLSFDTPGLYILSAIDYDTDYGFPLMSPWLAVTVTNSGGAPAVTSSGFANPPPAPLAPSEVRTDARTALGDTLSYLVSSQAPSPQYGQEWEILALARSGRSVPAGYYEGYYASVKDKLARVSSNQLSANSTDNSRLALALTAIGVNAANAEGRNLLAPLADYDYATGPGINGAVYALLAFDAKNYAIPPAPSGGAQTSRENLIAFILARELPGGGFSWSGAGEIDPDITAMALQALAPYKNSSADAGAAIARALAKLTAAQDYYGGYASWGSVSAENMAQVIVAAAALGLDPSADPQFTKGGGSAVSAMLRFYADGGGFQSASSPGAANAMSTYQAAYALAAYSRLLNHQNPLYDMRDCDITLTEGGGGQSGGGGSGPGGSTSAVTEITVVFRLIGGTIHLDGAEGHSRYIEWIPYSRYSFEQNQVSVCDALLRALNEAGLDQEGAEGNYLSGIRAPASLGGYWLREYDDGPYSGWLYSVNGVYQQTGIKDYLLSDGDVVLVHYTDDYTRETNLDNSGGGTGGGGVSGGGAASETEPPPIAASETAPPKENTLPDDEGEDPDEKTDAPREFPSEGWENPFSDVSSDDWFYEAVREAQTSGLMVGLPDGSFAPDSPATRAMAAQILFRFEKEPEAAGAEFDDVKSGDWYADAVAWASERGVAQGYGGGRFGAGDGLTNEQLAVMLRRLAGLIGIDTTETESEHYPRFADTGGASEWAEAAVKWAYPKGLLAQESPEAINPKTVLTRAEAAHIITTFLKLAVQRSE